MRNFIATVIFICLLSAWWATSNIVWAGPPVDRIPLTETQSQGYGCLITGVSGTGLALTSNLNEIILVIAGGTLIPTSYATVGVVIAGTVFASLCTVGAIITPAILHAWSFVYK